MFANRGGGLRPTSPLLVQACLTAYEFFVEANHESIVSWGLVFANGGGGAAPQTPPLF